MHDLLMDNHVNYNFQFQIRAIDVMAPRYAIDAYIPTIKLAIEYNGKQHYEPTGYFGSLTPQEDFIKQQIRDEYIRNFCTSNNIELIEIDGRDYYSTYLIEYMQNNLIPYIKLQTNRKIDDVKI